MPYQELHQRRIRIHVHGRESADEQYVEAFVQQEMDNRARRSIVCGQYLVTTKHKVMYTMICVICIVCVFIYQFSNPSVSPTNSNQNLKNKAAYNMVQEACTRIAPFCGLMGQDCGETTRISPYWNHKLRELLLGGGSVKGMVFGNSVAREHNFAPTRLWVEAVTKAIDTSFTMDYGQVNGGFELHHLLSCGGLEELMKGKDLAVIQYEVHTNAAALEKMVRLLSQMESKPVIVLISGCFIRLVLFWSHVTKYTSKRCSNIHPEHVTKISVRVQTRFAA